MRGRTEVGDSASAPRFHVALCNQDARNDHDRRRNFYGPALLANASSFASCPCLRSLGARAQPPAFSMSFSGS